MNITDRVRALQRTLPLIHRGYANYLHAAAADVNKKGKRIVLWSILWSDDGRVSFHRTDFVKKRPMSVPEWAGWLQVNAPHIMKNSVLAYSNRTFGSTWNIDRVFGWHFARRAAKR